MAPRHREKERKTLVEYMATGSVPGAPRRKCPRKIVAPARRPARRAACLLSGRGHARLHEKLADQRGMPAGAAGDEGDLLESLDEARVQAEFLWVSGPRVQGVASQQRVPDGSRLLVNFLQHEVLEALLLHLDRVPGDSGGRTVPRAALAVEQA